MPDSRRRRKTVDSGAAYSSVGCSAGCSVPAKEKKLKMNVGSVSLCLVDATRLTNKEKVNV